MSIKKLLKLIGVISFTFSYLLSAVAAEQDLAAGRWEFNKVGEAIWLPANVPGEVHLDLLAAKKIEDPFYGENERQLQWIDKEDWQYRTTFSVTSDVLKRDQVELVFKGLDTYADVYLNESLILQANNSHRQWRVDVKKHLKATENQLVVYFHSPIKKGLALRKQAPFVGSVANDNNGMGQVKEKVSVYTRKPHYHYGWDWGPRFVTSGIHDEIFLQSWDAARIQHVYYVQQKLEKEEATLSAQVNILADRDQEAVLAFSIAGKKVKQVSVSLKKGENTLKQDLSIKNPKLWWTHGLGEQHLYEMQVTLSDQKSDLDSNATRIGLRTIRLVQTPDENGRGRSFYFELNGVPVFMKGANYIPQDSFITRPTAETYRKLIDNTVAANMNMLRIWGGGIYEKDIFYDLCDEMGVLIWEDFMFANRDYLDIGGFHSNVEAEAKDAVLRLRNHACIALWCGNNEMAWQNQSSYKLNKDKDRYFSEVYQKIFHDILPSVVNELDPSTKYWPSSPSPSEEGGRPRMNTGDYHNWNVWHGRKPFDHYEQSIPRFMSEYGFQSFPSMETIKTFSTKADWDIDSPVMRNHQKNGTGNQKIKTYMGQYYGVPDDFEAFVYLSQVQQAEAIKVGIEAHRRKMPYCMGSLYWQLNDCWPVASWSSLDYYGHWKALHYQARDSFAPILISFEEDKGRLKVVLVSDRLESLAGELDVTLMDFEGNPQWRNRASITVKPNASAVYMEVEIPQDTRKTMVAVATLRQENTRVTSRNYYFERVVDLELPKVEVKTEVARTDEGYAVTLSSSKLAKSVYLSVEGHMIHFEDNFFDLLPNQPKLVHGRVAEAIPGFEQHLRVMTLSNMDREKVEK